MNKRRLITNGILVISVFMFPFWMTAMFIVAAIIFIPRMYEIFCYTLYIDLIGGVPLTRFFRDPIFVTTVTIVVCAVVEFLRPRILSRS